MFVSTDVVFWLTDVHLSKTVDIILMQVYTKNLINALSECSLKKLIRDTCQKTLSFNNKLHEQIDGVSMSGSLGIELANTECRKSVIDKLMKKKVMFYTRYVDNTLLIIKKKDINYVLNQLNNFDKNLIFTTNTLENSVPHFLDIKICPNGFGIYQKHTQIWRWKTLIRSLVIRAKKICSANYFNNKT